MQTESSVCSALAVFNVDVAYQRGKKQATRKRGGGKEQTHAKAAEWLHLQVEGENINPIGDPRSFRCF